MNLWPLLLVPAFVMSPALLAQNAPGASFPSGSPGSPQTTSNGVQKISSTGGELEFGGTDCKAGPEGSGCEHHAAVFSVPVRPNGEGHRSLTLNDFRSFGPSINFGNSGSWTVTHVRSAPHIVFGTSGIDQYDSAAIVKNGTGDLAGIYYYVFGGGRAAQSDEGVTGLTVESGEINGYFHGTVAGGAATGATALDLHLTAGATHNWASTCNGCMLLDISKGRIAGLLNGKSIPFGTYLNQLPTTAVTVAGAPAALPLTHAWCSTSAPIPPSATAGQGTSRTVSCRLGEVGHATPSFARGGVVTIAGQYYPEQATLVDVSTVSDGVQTLTLLARNPNPAGSMIFQGGIAGQSLSFDANLATTGFRTSYYVFGSVDGVHLIYGSQIAGNVGLNHQLPRLGAEAEQLDSGFHLYPGAEVVANTAKNSSPQLEPNDVNWETGDIAENPRFMSYGGSGIMDVCQQFTPTDQDASSGCLRIDVQGPAVSGTYKPMRLRNGNALSMYRQGGGVLDPVPALLVEGPFGDFFDFHNGPSSGGQSANAVINIRGTAGGDNKPFNLFALPQGRNGSVTVISYDPATLAVGFPGGLVAGRVGTSSNCSSAARSPNCGAAIAGSIAIAPGATSVMIATSAVTAKSQILITPDASLDGKLGITCNRDPATAFAPFGISARTPGTGFVLSIAANAGANPNCYSFSILN